jgi:hypothetical protein
MKTLSVRLIAICIVLLVTLCATAALARGPADGRIPAEQPPDEGAPSLPDPVEPVPAPPVPLGLLEGVQLLGYTVERIGADRGILNMNRLCQREFRGSRLCTADEILNTVFVPPVAQGVEGLAWVRTAGSMTVHDLLFLNSTPGLEDWPHDCRGWTSATATDSGIATTIACEKGCAGGFAVVDCDSYLGLACCGLMRPAPQPEAR